MDSLKEQMIRLLQKSENGLTARDLSKMLDVRKSEINQVLYAERSRFFPDGSRVPIWKTINSDTSSQNTFRTSRDRIHPPIVLEKTIEIDIRAKLIKVDVVLLEKSRNDEFYSLEPKSSGHILIAVSRIFENRDIDISDANQNAPLQAWQILLVAIGILEYVYSLEQDVQIERMSGEIGSVVRKITAQLSNTSL